MKSNVLSQPAYPGAWPPAAVAERLLVEFGKANLIDKARQQPDKVKTDGLLSAVEAIGMIGRRAWADVIPGLCI